MSHLHCIECRLEHYIGLSYQTSWSRVHFHEYEYEYEYIGD